jgi:hypothetical protein
MVLVRPFKTKTLNLLNIATEFNVTIGYFFNIFFIIEGGMNYEVAAWIILSAIVSTYAIHNLLIIYKVICAIVDKLRRRYRNVDPVVRYRIYECDQDNS